MNADDLFRFLSLGFFGAIIFVVVSNGDKVGPILTGAGDFYSGSIKAIEGR